ncbi:porin [Psychromonas sp.]|uniref:porin n=1 Tax=Psychromonas sp. TaxID=1884585 RepID=UPI0035677C6F
MKKTLLATAILTGLVSTAQAGVTVFKDDSSQVDLKGRIYAGYINQDNNDADKSRGSSDAYFRLGLDGKSQLTEDLKAIGKLEMQWAIADDDKQDTTRTRLAYAGVQSALGTVTFGRQYATDEMVADWTDSAVSNVPGNDALNEFGRESSVLKFENTYMDALTVGAHMQLENSYDADEKDDTDEKSGYGIGAVFATDLGLELGATYGIETKGDIDTDTILLGAQYKIADLTAAVVYDITHKDKDEASHNALETSLAYGFGKASVVGRYLQKDVDGKADYTVEQFTFGAAYKFNKNFRVVAEYVADQVKDQDDLYTFAARYDF